MSCDAGSINGDIYRKKVVPFIQKAAYKQQKGIFGQPSVVMQDNAIIHTARATITLFLDKPANSPDLNPTENIWTLLKHRIGLHFPTTRTAVIEAVQLERSRLTVADISRACQSMRQRCQAVIDAEGGHTKW